MADEDQLRDIELLLSKDAATQEDLSRLVEYCDRSHELNVRRSAIDAIRRLGVGESELPALFKCIAEGEDSVVMFHATLCIAQLGPLASGCINRLLSQIPYADTPLYDAICQAVLSFQTSAVYPLVSFIQKCEFELLPRVMPLAREMAEFSELPLHALEARVVDGTAM